MLQNRVVSGQRGNMPKTIMIRLNGEEYSTGAATLAGLISELGLEQRMIAIERNLEVVPKSQYASTPLITGDRIELVHMIGGG
ncbi:hypothetical protein SPV1_03018 [Mariprofundus ferrooxydans PV-1]|uniref:Thiamine biosynthesis protein ThiS n=2 Tax=Mariprofundus ferrooxydans TaxID=314344 RepID=Q0EW96_9PROT|nr:hypothetical protein SPV1_03018 [Mariprofundus ferrooxydans PV-1]